MAKAKKKELTLEEKLEQALVPEDEWPYEVPGNWVWTRLGYLIEVSKEKCENFSGSEQKYIGLEHIQKDSGIIGYGNSKRIKSLKNVFYLGEILYGKLRPYLNKHDIASFDGVCSTDILVFRTTEITVAKFVNYFFDTDKFIGYAVSNSKGINLPRISESVILDAIMPLPPLAEQQRIVDRIESLFAKLNQAKELAQNALDTFETRKAAILHKAFTGELTAKWREKNEANLVRDWKEKKLVDVCSKITDGTHNSPKNFDAGDYMYVTAKNIKEYGIDLSNITYIPEEVHREIYKRCNVEYEDVLYIKDGATTGIATINTIKEEFSLLSSVALLKPNREILDSKYLAYILNSSEIRTKMLNNMSGNAIRRLTINKIKKSTIIVPSLPEQQEIVRILDSLFEKEQKAKELYDVIEKIDLMKKTILAHAFRGDLGTNDPSEESATELLKECLK